jgi:TANFOR domain-containing protein
MYSHSNNKSITRLLLAIAFVALASLGSVKAQGDFFSNKISLTVNPVMPPYTAKLSDYFTTPGKIGGSIMVNSQIDASSYQFYLHVAIINVETEASVRTRRGFVPSNPRTVDLSVIPNTTLIQHGDLQQAMSEQNLEYSGFTREQVAREGLPPGQYRIKLTLFIFPNGWNGFMEVGSKYSPPFTIMPVAVEPPIIIQPHDGAEIPAELTQTLQFTWTMPPGAPASTRYKLKIIEINDPGLNYRDLLRTDAYPAFFETTVTGMPLYLYTVANPAFTEGKSYAFVVRAIDPFGKTNFKNGGYSEVAIFKKKESVMNRIIESLRSYLLPQKTGEE